MRRVLSALWKTLALTLVFVLALVSGALLHLDSRPGLRVIKREINANLGPLFVATIEVKDLRSVGLFGVRGLSGRLIAPDQTEIISFTDATANVNVIGILQSVLFDEGPMVIRIEELRISSVHLTLDRDAASDLKIAKAFALRHPSPPTPPDAPKGRAVDVAMPHIEAQSIHVDGSPAADLQLDADITDLQTNVRVSEPGVHVGLERGKLATKLPELVPGKPRAMAMLWLGGELMIPSAGFGPLAVQAEVLGNVDGVPLSVAAAMRDDVVQANVLVPQSASERIAAFTGAPLQGPIAVRALAFGPLSRLGFSTRANLGDGGAEANGYAGVVGAKSVLAHVGARRLDLQTFGSARSSIVADVDAELAAPSNAITEPTGFVRVRTEGSTIQDAPLPNALAYARVTSGHFVLDANVDEPGVPAKVHAEGSAKTPITFTTNAQIALGAIERVKLPIGGGLSLRADGTLDPRSLDLRASATVRGQSLALPGGVALGQLAVDAKVSGKAASPQIATEVHARGIKVADMTLSHLSANSVVSIGPPLRIEDTRVAAHGHGESVVVEAARVELGADGGVRIRDGKVEGLGEPMALSGDYSKQAVSLALAARHIDLARVGRFFSIDDIRGDATIHADLRGRGQDLQGKVTVGLTKGAFDVVRGAEAHLEVELEGRELSVQGRGNLGRAGKFQIDAPELHLERPPLAPHAFEHVYGQLGVDATIDFARLPRFVAALRGKDVQGMGHLTGHVSRTDGTSLPDATIAFETYGLSFLLPPPTEADEVASATSRDGAASTATEAPTPASAVTASATPAAAPAGRTDGRGKSVVVKRGLLIAGIDVAANVHVDAVSGFTGVAARLHDKFGIIIAADAKADLAYAELARIARESPNDLVPQLYDASFNAKVVVAERDLQTFPSILGLGGARGKAGAHVDFSGSARAPRIALLASGRGLRDAEGSAKVTADTDVTLTYDGTTLAVDVDAKSGAKGRAAVRLRATGKSADFLTAHDPLQAPWAAALRVDTTAFPLTFIPMPDGQKLRGEATGFILLDDFHKNASLSTKFDLSNVRIARASFPKISIEATAKDALLKAAARLDQKDGNATFDANAGFSWGKKLVPSISTERALEATFNAANLNAAAFLPFAGAALSDLDGRIEAKAHVKAGADGKNVKMDGSINYHDGILGIPAVGQEFRDAMANVVFRPDGTIQLVEARARDATGEFRLTASAHFNDLIFDSAEAVLAIPKESPLDMAVQGQSLGEVWGTVKTKVAAAKDGSVIAANVSVPSLHAKLSDNGTRSLQPLEAPDNINVGRLTKRGIFVAVPRTAADYHGTSDAAAPAAKTKVTINVQFGEDVEVKRGGTAPFQARFNGKLAIASADALEVRGQLALNGGSVDLQGKKFEIERGTVTFNGDDPTNPVIIATAGWTAADRSRVYADFVGPVRTGNVTLRSEPAHTKNEILSLILFGTPDGYSNTGGQFNAQQSAATVGGGAIGKGLDKALDDVVGIETQTRIDTTNANNPRPELEIMISRTVSLAFAHVLGTPPISQPDVNLGTVKWRFAPRWSLATTFGDRGKASVDTLWNYMY